MVFSFLQRKCHFLTRCTKILLTSREEEHNTNIKKGYALCLPLIKKIKEEMPICSNKFSNFSSSDDEDVSNWFI